MDFGIFDHVERQSKDLSALYEGRLRMLEAADRGGFYCYHVAEHHGTPLSMTSSPNLLLASVAQRTERIKLGSLCYILPLYDPIRLMYEICMLDQLSDGRLQVGVSRGISPIELGFYGLNPKETPAIFKEDLEIILLGLTSKSVTYEGAYHSYHDLPIEMTPRQEPYPPIWYPTSGLESIPWVAQNGFQAVFNGGSDHVANQVKIYKDNLPDGADLKDFIYGVSRYVFIAETDAEAMKLGEVAYAKHRANLNYLRDQRGITSRSAVPDTAGSKEDNPIDVKEAVSRGWAVAGSPSTVIDQIGAIQAATGCNYLVFNPLLGDTSTAQGIANVELFAQEVIPALKAI